MAEDEGQSSTPLASQLRWLIGIRLVVITSVGLPAFLFQFRSLADDRAAPSLYTLAGLTYAASLVYILLLRQLRHRPVVQAYIQFFGDLALITGLVWNSGGVNSPFSILYLIVIALASTLIGRRAGLHAAAVSWLMYALVVAALSLGWIPSSIGIDASAPAWRVGYSLFVHLFGFSAVALLTSHLAEQTRRVQADLTAKKQDLAALQTVHQDIVESIPSGLITADLEASIVAINPAGREILGLTDDEPDDSIIDDLQMMSRSRWDSLTVAAREGRLVREEAEWERDGQSRCIGFTLSMLRTADGLLAGYILIFQDLSPFRKLQEEIQMKDRMAAVGELAAGIAHEVGNPLAAISGSVQMLNQAEDRSSPRAKLLQIIFKESQRLDRTIKGFLQYAQPLDQRNLEFDLSSLLRDKMDLLRNSPEVSDRHRLQLDLQRHDGTVVGDPDQVSQIFWNLSQNAIRAMPEGGTLRVEGRFDERQFRLSFSDTGRGMTEEEKASIFHPFRSFFDTGSGIGMAIVYRIVQDRHGHISVGSQRGVGTTIIVELPVDGSVTELATAEG